MWFVICLTFVIVVNGLGNFPDFIPNGRKVNFEGGLWTSLGHKVRQSDTPSGGNGLNLFGVDVDRTRNDGPPNWQAVCDLDSDKDGLTNGEELLDPNCVWRSEDDNALLEEGIPTHPGFAGASPGTPAKIKIHAAFMTLAWLVFAPVGVLTAVVLKVKTKTKTAVNWFKVHKVCVGTAVYLTMIAYICMVYEREDFLFINTHTRIGHAVVILAIIQPLSGFWRFHINKNGSKSFLRLAWEYQHQWTGRVLIVLAVVAVYFGYDIAGFIDQDVSTAVQVISIILLIVGGGFCIVWVTIRKDERKEPDLPVKKEPQQQEQEKSSSSAVNKDVPIAEVVTEEPKKEEKTDADKLIEEVKKKQEEKAQQEKAKEAKEAAAGAQVTHQ